MNKCLLALSFLMFIHVLSRKQTAAKWNLFNIHLIMTKNSLNFFRWMLSQSRNNILSSRREGLGWMSGENSLQREWWGARSGRSGRLWMLHPCRCSRPGWMGPWITCSSTRSGGWWLCLWQWGWNLVIHGVPSNSSGSMILWKLMFCQQKHCNKGNAVGRQLKTSTSLHFPSGWKNDYSDQARYL